MQLTAPYSLYTLLLVQCILAACIQAAALPAALPATLPATADTERLLQQLSEMEDSPPQEHRSRSERGAVLPDHNYAQTVIDRREFWRYQDCQQKFNCGKISWQHCTDQPAKVSSLDAFRVNSDNTAVCEMDFQVFVGNTGTVTGLDIALYLRADRLNPNFNHYLFFLQKNGTNPYLIMSTVVKPGTCNNGWLVLRQHETATAVTLKQGINSITIFVALHVDAGYQACSEIKKVFYMDKNEEDYFSDFEQEQVDPNEEEVDPDEEEEESKESKSSSESTVTAKNDEESTSTKALSTTETVSTTDTTENAATTQTVSTAENIITTETVTTAEYIPSTETATTTETVPTMGGVEETTLDSTTPTPTSSMEDRFLPIFTLFIDEDVVL